jgi:flagellar motility protein MotE (MotC chaperone)
MKRLLQNPIFVLAIGTVLGLTTGIGWIWKASAAIVARHAVAPVSLETEEQRAQGWDFWTIEIDSLANELKEEKARQQKAAEQLDARAGRLAAEEQELARVRRELEQMREEIDGRVLAIGEDEMKNLRSLAQAYSNLSPRAAVAIVSELDDPTVVKILSLMKADVVGPIFEEMTKTTGADGPLSIRAAALSEKLRLMKKASASST